MQAARRPAPRRTQRGAALLILAALMVMGGTWFMVATAKSAAEQSAGNQQHNARVLAEAKQALIGYVAQRALDASEGNPGRMPCPEESSYVGTTNEGIVAIGNNCTLPAVGRLPWRTLGLPKLLDATGEPLWYVLSPGWALPSSTATISINSNTVGQLAVNGQSNAAVALIIAPGAPLTLAPTSAQTAEGCASRTQARTSAVTQNHLDYLECQNVTGASLRTSVTANATNAVFNDQAVTVTAAEVLAAIEGPVAARIQRDVLPQLQSVYDTTEWGASTTAPIFPFPARFADNPATTFNPDSFKGSTLSNNQGLLPLTAATCNTLTAGRCDDTFVQWVTSSIAVSEVSGSAESFSADCSASTASLVSCSVTYSRDCGFFCSLGMRVGIQVTATNVGMTMKTLTTAGTTGGSAPSFTAPIQSSGNANGSYAGTLTTVFCFGNPCTATRTVTIPITVFEDHPLVNPSTSDAWYWFIANNWHHVTYYAVAPSHSPAGGTHNCTVAGDCLTVTGMTPPSNLQAVVALAGRSLTGAARTNANLADFLDSTTNRDGDNAFEQAKTGRSFNDRFLSVSNY